jgi:hypothetical protein
MLGTLFGSIFGFQFKWGPIIWGVIGAVSGGSVGLCISLIKARIKKRTQQNAHKENVVIMVNCETNQSQMVQDVLWSNTAMGVNTFGM